MKFGIRTPSLKRRISARTSLKRYVRHSMGLKAPKGMGFITNPKKAVYNKIYNKTSVSIDSLIKTTNKRSSSSKTSKAVKNDIWNTGNFKTREELLNKAKKINIKTGKYICPRCGEDLWAIAYVKILFWGGDAVFCQKCGKPGQSVDEFKDYL